MQVASLVGTTQIEVKFLRSDLHLEFLILKDVSSVSRKNLVHTFCVFTCPSLK